MKGGIIADKDQFFGATEIYDMKTREKMKIHIARRGFKADLQSSRAAVSGHAPLTAESLK
jgi:hypothetical protein